MSRDAAVDPEELSKFERHGSEWWDPHGPFAALHALNPVRLRFIETAGELDGKRVLDVGCGGGVLSEQLARRGASVVGLDPSPAAIRAAKEHALEAGLSIDYRVGTVDGLKPEDTPRFDLIACMELLEHVPDAGGLLTRLAPLLRRGGALFVATINRTPQAFLGAIVGAEYLFSLLPRGTHAYRNFIRPAELCRWTRAAGLEVVDLAGVRFLPWINRAALSNRPAINYMLHARLPD